MFIKWRNYVVCMPIFSPALTIGIALGYIATRMEETPLFSPDAILIVVIAGLSMTLLNIKWLKNDIDLLVVSSLFRKIEMPIHHAEIDSTRTKWLNFLLYRLRSLETLYLHDRYQDRKVCLGIMSYYGTYKAAQTMNKGLGISFTSKLNTRSFQNRRNSDLKLTAISIAIAIIVFGIVLIAEHYL